jgi:uroporphyrinogen decarboxylase
MLMDLMLEEEFVRELFTRITQRNAQILDIALEYDFDGVYFGDDYGQQTGLLISPDTWRRCVKPYLRILFEKAKSKGKIVCLHSCGNISGILSDLIDIGLDVYQTVQPEVYDLKKLKKEFGSNLCFYGGISTQRDLPFKTPKEIFSIVKETMQVLGEGGGYIAAPTHRVTPDTPASNIIAMVEALREQESSS